MGGLVIDGIATLVTNDPTVGRGPLGIVDDAAVVVEADRMVWVGPRAELPQGAGTDHVDAAGGTLLPGFVDSHAHLVFAGDRSGEFVARMAGQPYTAGGIASTVAATRAATDADLDAAVARLVVEALRGGTTTIECKSGYGLSVADEQRSLRVARRHSEEVTFLGAHVVPPEYAARSDDYVDLVCTDMMAACAPHADWVDVFCDRGAFDADQARAVLNAGLRHGLRPRVHANQLTAGPGVQLAVAFDAASADHVTHLTPRDVDALAAGTTVATLLPAAEFATRSPYPDARRLLDAGATVALATDCNPGSSYTTSMSFCIALAVRELGMTPDEAVWSATAGGARALRRADVGVVAPGARADLLLLAAPSHVYLSYRPGVPLVRGVWRAGQRVVSSDDQARLTRR